MALPTIPEYNSCITNPALVHPAILKGGQPLTKGKGTITCERKE